MLRFACEYMIGRTGARIADRIALIPEPRSAYVILRSIFEEMLPLSEDRRIGIRVWMAFLARAVVREDLEAFAPDPCRNSPEHRRVVEEGPRAGRR